MPHEQTYESTAVDWQRVHSYARQVAQQTSVPLQNPITYTASDDGRQIEAVGLHWLLDAREHYIEDTYQSAVETSHDHYYIVLLPDGVLKEIWIGVEEHRVVNPYGSEPITYERNHRVADVGEAEIKLFDFGKSAYENPPVVGFSTKRSWGNYHLGHGQTRIANRKGDGILRSLEDLRRGTLPNQAPHSPQYFHSPNVRPAPPDALARGVRAPNAPRAGTMRRPLVLAGIVALVVAAVLLFTFRDKPQQGAPGPATNPITNARQIVEHLTIPEDATNNAIRSMTLQSCWNGRWSWSNTDKEYLLLAEPTTVGCSSPDATQQLYLISDTHTCRGTAAQMTITKGTEIGGQTYCQQLVPSEGMCLPLRSEGGRGNYRGLPVVCDTPPSPQYPSVMRLTNRLNSNSESCDAHDGLYYIWFQSMNTGFCFTIMT